MICKHCNWLTAVALLFQVTYSRQPLKQSIQPLLQFLGGHGSHDLIYRLTIFEKNQGGHTPDLKLGRRHLMAAGIEFTDNRPAAVLSSQLLDNRGQSMTGPAGW
jgi:hypothetical protein